MTLFLLGPELIRKRWNRLPKNIYEVCILKNDMRSKYCCLWFVFTYSSRDETRIKHFILLYWLFSEVHSKLFGSSLEMTRATQQAFVFVLRRNMVSVHIQKKMFRKIVLALHHCTVKRMVQKQLYVIIKSEKKSINCKWASSPNYSNSIARLR